MATRTIGHRGPAGDDARARYTRVAIWLHWLIAAAILYNLASGLAGAWLPRGFFALHISSGLTILVLSLVRVGWRLTHRPPPMLPMRAWEARLAHAAHAALYAAMILLPLSGWALISASPPSGSAGAAAARAEAVAKARAEGRPAPAPRGAPLLWGLVPVPKIAPIAALGAVPDGLPRQRALHARIEAAHLAGGWVLLALFVLHVAGALKHQLADREPELARMGLGRRRAIDRSGSTA